MKLFSKRLPEDNRYCNVIFYLFFFTFAPTLREKITVQSVYVLKASSVSLLFNIFAISIIYDLLFQIDL